MCWVKNNSTHAELWKLAIFLLFGHHVLEEFMVKYKKHMNNVWFLRFPNDLIHNIFTRSIYFFLIFKAKDINRVKFIYLFILINKNKLAWFLL